MTLSLDKYLERLVAEGDQMLRSYVHNEKRPEDGGILSPHMRVNVVELSQITRAICAVLREKREAKLANKVTP